MRTTVALVLVATLLIMDVKAALGFTVGAMAGAVAYGVMANRKGFPPLSCPAASVDNQPEEIYESKKDCPPEKLLDGKKVAKEIEQELTEATVALQEEYNLTPGLAVVLVGNRKDSANYVAFKKKAMARIGYYSLDVNLDENVSEDELLAEVEKLNQNDKIHGILVQLPLPRHIDSNKVLKSIRVEKDADGFHALNVGNLWLSGGDPPLAVACTPAGCVELLQRYDVTVSGKNVVVIGRSNIVGMPVCALLQSMNGTVTCCHSRTQNIEDKVRGADIIIAAIGKADFVRGPWVKKGAVVIDVGMNWVLNDKYKAGGHFKGDVCFNEVAPKCKFITPVPGGVGPMTIAMLCMNTYNLARHSIGLPRRKLRKNPSHVNIGKMESS